MACERQSLRQRNRKSRAEVVESILADDFIHVATGIVRTDLGAGSPKRSAFTDLFVRRKGQWFAVNAQELPLSPGASPGS